MLDMQQTSVMRTGVSLYRRRRGAIIFVTTETPLVGLNLMFLEMESSILWQSDMSHQVREARV